MGEILHDLSPPQLVGAIEANMFDFWSQLGRSPRVELHDGPDMIRLVGDLSSPFCNNVLRAQLASDGIDASIEAALVPFRSRKLPMRWWISPSTRPADLGRLLEAYGLTHLQDTPGMAVDLLELNEGLTAPFGLTVERVGDLKALERWIEAFTGGYEVAVPEGRFLFDALANLGMELPWRHYIGWVGGEPVATSSLLLSGGVAGIYALATVPEARGQGIGVALTLAPLIEARAMGYRIGVLASSEMALGVYRRVGFQEYCKFRIYFLSGETAQSA